MKTKKNIVIEDGIVKLQKTEIYKEVSLQDFFNTTAKNASLSSGLLPRNCRYYEKSNLKETLIVEDYPTVREIKVVGTNTRIIKFKISLPWMIYIFAKTENKINNFYMFCSRKQITSLNDFLYEIPLSNINQSGNVCLGNINKKTKPEVLIKEFWNSTFNQDYLPEWFKNKKGGIRSYRNWHNQTKKDASFILNVRFIKYKKIKDFLNHNSDERNERRIGINLSNGGQIVVNDRVLIDSTASPYTEGMFASTTTSAITATDTIYLRNQNQT